MTEDEDRLQKDLNVLNMTVEKLIEKTVESYSVTRDMDYKMSGIVVKKKDEEDELMNKKKEKWLEDKPKERKKQKLPATKQRYSCQGGKMTEMHSMSRGRED